MNATSNDTWEAWAKAATHPADAPSKPEALDGIMVLDLSRANIGGDDVLIHPERVRRGGYSRRATGG